MPAPADRVASDRSSTDSSLIAVRELRADASAKKDPSPKPGSSTNGAKAKKNSVDKKEKIFLVFEVCPALSV